MNLDMFSNVITLAKQVRCWKNMFALFDMDVLSIFTMTIMGVCLMKIDQHGSVCIYRHCNDIL